MGRVKSRKGSLLVGQKRSSAIIINIIMILFSLLFLIPFLQVIMNSVSSSESLMQSGARGLIPTQLDFTAYKLLFASNSILASGVVSVMRVLLGTFIQLTVTALLAFGLSRKQLFGRNVCITLIFITMIFSGGLIPSYMVVDGLRLTNTIWALVLPGAVSTYYFIVMKTFFQDIPLSLEEAATIDGANQFQYFMIIAVPLSMPMLAAMALFFAVGHWIAWFDAAIYIRDYDKMPLQVLLRDTIINFSSQTLQMSLSAVVKKRPPGIAVRSALMVITTFPIVIIYPFLQKYFVKGIMIGSIKG